MTPEQADTLANEFIDCMVKKTISDPPAYGENLKWASKSELRKALCIHLARVQLKGIKINLRPNNDLNKKVPIKDFGLHLISLSYSEMITDVYSFTSRFMEIGHMGFDVEDDCFKLTLEFDSYSKFLGSLNIDSESYWNDVLNFLKVRDRS